MTPRNKEFVFKKAHSKELWGIAAADFESAKALLETKRGRPETACFLAQQAIEKGLKAVLIHLEVPVPLVHDAAVLVAKLPQTLNPPRGYDLAELTPFATSLRYREGDTVLTPEQIEIVFETAKEVLDWCGRQLKK